MPYVLRYDQDRAQLVGPFDDNDQAARWAASPVNNPNDDPRWSVVGNPEVTVIEPMALARPAEVFYLSYTEITITLEN